MFVTKGEERRATFETTFALALNLERLQILLHLKNKRKTLYKDC
jgi:hypothetical protein